jgi:hypothetical protein
MWDGLQVACGVVNGFLLPGCKSDVFFFPITYNNIGVVYFAFG